MTRKGAPLQGIRVIDLTRHLPGPLASLMLLDLGADVVKVEHPEGGDPVRNVPPFIGGFGAAFAALNRGKKSLAIDLKHEEARAVLLELIRRADIVLEGFRPGVMKRLGIDYDELKDARPDIILCSLTGYGQSGPLASRAGHDINYQARSGVLALNGPRDAAPIPVGVQVADACGAWQAVAAVLGALFVRQREGRGQWIDVSLCEAAFTTTWLAAADTWAGGSPAPRGHGALSGGGLPGYGVFRCADGRYLAVGALEPKFYRRLCDVLGLPHLASRWANTGTEADHARRKFAEAFAKRPRSEWMEIFEAEDVCVDPVLEGAEILKDPQMLERNMFVDVCFGESDGARLPASPLRLGDATLARQPPPRLGQHTVEILQQAGFDKATIEGLAESGAIGIGSD